MNQNRRPIELGKLFGGSRFLPLPARRKRHARAQPSRRDDGHHLHKGRLVYDPTIASSNRTLQGRMPRTRGPAFHSAVWRHSFLGVRPVEVFSASVQFFPKQHSSLSGYRARSPQLTGGLKVIGGVKEPV